MRSARRHFAVLGAYALLAAGMTWPLLPRFASAVPGAGGDCWLFFWDMWWVKRALVDLHTDPFFTTAVHQPTGAPLYFHSLLFLPSLLAIPVVATLGLTVAYNLIAFASFPLSGWAVYLLALDMEPTEPANRARRRAAFLAGLVFAFSAYRMVRLGGHLELLQTQCLPFYALFLQRAWRDPGRSSVVGAALALVATALTSWYYALFLGCFTALFVAERLATRVPAGHAGHGRSLGRVALAVGAAGALLSPILVPMLVLGRTEGRVLDPGYDADRFSADLLAFVVPSHLQSLWGSALWPFLQRLARNGNVTEIAVFLGYVPLLLAVWGLREKWDGRRLWLFVFAGSVALSAGPTLHVMGEAVSLFGHPVPMPYRLLDLVPYVDIGRAPARFGVLAGLALALLAGRGVSALQRRLGSWAPVALVPLAGAVLLETTALPYPMTPVEVPAVHRWLAAEPGGAVLEVPFPPDPAVVPRRMLHQTVHGRPTYGGYLSRGLPPLTDAAVPGFLQLQTLSPHIEDVVRYDDAHVGGVSRTALQLLGARHVLVDKTLLTDADLERARTVVRSIFGDAPPAYEDATAWVQRVPAGGDDETPFLYLLRGWSYLERGPAVANGPAERWRWMGSAAEVGLVAPRRLVARLRLRAWPLRQPCRLALGRDGEDEGSLTLPAWSADHWTAPIEVEVGHHRLSLESLHGTASPGRGDRRQVSAAFSEIELVPLPPTLGRVELGRAEARRHLGDGWSYEEGGFRWTTGPEADLFFAVDQTALASRGRADVVLSLRLRPFLVPGKHDRQEVELELNGRAVETYSLDEPAATTLSVLLPAGGLRSSNRLRLRVRKPVSPASLGVSGDSRALGVAVEWLEVQKNQRT